MSKLEELRERIINAFGDNKYNVAISINPEGNHLMAIYKGHSVCIITDWYDLDGTYYMVFADNFVSEPYLPLTKRCMCVESIKNYIEQRIEHYNKKKGQNNMMILSDLRDYLKQELGDVVTVICDPAVGPFNNSDRIRIKRDGCGVCSIYRKKSNYDLFTVIFYVPFTCKSMGYSPVVDLTVDEIPIAIKNRIDICENNNRIDININADDNTVAKAVYMMMARGNGKTRLAADIMKSGTFIFNGIKDVIFNDPATIVFWNDGSKTVVKCQPGETFDPEKGLAMAISKKVLGNDYGYYETFAKYVGRYNKKHKEK